MNEIFSERSYEIDGEGTIRVRIGEPVQNEGHWTWSCPLRIDWPDGRITDSHGQGVDRLDALLTAVAVVRLNIETRDQYLDGKVRWALGDELHLKVPVPDSHIEWVQEQLASRRS